MFRAAAHTLPVRQIGLPAHGGLAFGPVLGAMAGLESFQQFGCGLVAIGLRLGEASHDEVVHVDWQIGGEDVWRRDGLLGVSGDQFHQRCAEEGWLAGDEEIGDTSHGVDVAAGVDGGRIVGLFGRHVQG